jgi:hypothetical protein
MRYIARALAALAMLTLALFGATQAQAAPTEDPYTLCGETFMAEAVEPLPQAMVYLMYDPAADVHCVVTIKDDPSDTQEVAAWINDEYGYIEDRNYGPYAGPLFTNSHAFYWGGSHGPDSTGDIYHEHAV